ncbi:2-oxoglutarate-dependent dioxygenase [Lachnellula willkommii]|uniref:2-oxoglutarate-dependent dioxygenase n=1 Tax=Lachnellula willkommii TaxID=215461 RepID=A0A559MM92_9HELO|nr:2-oxoglutarate-dependent dioxygenase [Lachnellula willkommii]
MGSIENNVPESIPTVDISPFLDPDASPAAVSNVVETMRHACTTYGFFYLVGYEVQEADRLKALECAKRFFSLPHEEKMDVWIGKAMGRSFRGYEPPSLQIHKEGLLPDTKEGYILGLETPADAPGAGTFHTGPNQWPKSLSDEEFRSPLMDYHGKMIEMVKVLLKILARGLPKSWNCPPDVFDELTIKPSVPMRLLHYPPQPVRHENQFGGKNLSLMSLAVCSDAPLGEHTDFGNVSVLLQEEGTEGLEVFYPPTKTWIPVPVKTNSYVINMGDMMQKWTAGYYRSALTTIATPKLEAAIHPGLKPGPSAVLQTASEYQIELM